MQHTITCDTVVKIVHGDEAPVLLVQGDILLAVLQHLVMEAAHVTERRGRRGEESGTYNIELPVTPSSKSSTGMRPLSSLSRVTYCWQYFSTSSWKLPT